MPSAGKIGKISKISAVTGRHKDRKRMGRGAPGPGRARDPEIKTQRDIRQLCTQIAKLDPELFFKYSPEWTAVVALQAACVTYKNRKAADDG